MTNMCQKSRVAHRRGIFSLLFAGLSVLILLPALAGCDRGVPDWRDILKAEPAPTSTPSAKSIKTTNELVVYLDESGSMAGYVTRDGQTIFGKALRELRYATGTFTGSDARVLVRHVGSDVGPPLPDMDLTTASQDPSVYRAGETNLAGAIDSFKVGYQNPAGAQRKAAPQDDGPKANPPDPQPPARFQILVTDGVQSTKRGNSIQDCTAGSDQFCVRQKIGELLKAGWAGCILGVRADFHGKVYSEVSGAGIPYETKSSDPSSFRPFYFYIFSPDPTALDSLVRSLKERLRPLLTNCSECLRELNLSFPYNDGFADFEVVIPKESRDAVQKTKNPGGPTPRFTIRVDVNTERSGPKPLTIQIKVPWSKHAVDAGNEQELMQLLSWKAVPFYPADQTKERLRFPEINITGTHFDAGQLVLDVTTSFPPGTEKPSWRVYRLEGRVNLNQGTPAWIRAWSTDLDTKREVANRTFNLETALLNLWNNSSAKDQVVAKAYLRIGPSD
jgi:hypothetical protein